MKIKDKIQTIRGKQVILDRDLAELYEVSTKALNQAVKRNNERFPEDFMFQLGEKELSNWKSQIVTSNKEKMGLRKKPYAFTEHGITALAGVLRSSKAISVNIQIIRAFVAMRKFIASNEGLFQRLNTVEFKQIEHDKQFEKVFTLIESKNIQPSKGIFFDGEIFDAYVFVSDLVKKAKKSIILIDNYIDESILTLLSKKGKHVKLSIYTKNINKQLKLDVEKFSKQYGEIILKKFDKSHDRFLIVDEETYHFGASLKDLGKKWFAFSKFNKENIKLIEKLEE